MQGRSSDGISSRHSDTGSEPRAEAWADTGSEARAEAWADTGSEARADTGHNGAGCTRVKVKMLDRRELVVHDVKLWDKADELAHCPHLRRQRVAVNERLAGQGGGGRQERNKQELVGGDDDPCTEQTAAPGDPRHTSPPDGCSTPVNCTQREPGPTTTCEVQERQASNEPSKHTPAHPHTSARHKHKHNHTHTQNIYIYISPKSLILPPKHKHTHPLHTLNRTVDISDVLPGSHQKGGKRGEEFTAVPTASSQTPDPTPPRPTTTPH